MKTYCIIAAKKSQISLLAFVKGFWREGAKQPEVAQLIRARKKRANAQINRKMEIKRNIHLIRKVFVSLLR